MTTDEQRNEDEPIINIDQDKLDAWNDVKGDYQLDPSGMAEGGEEPSGVGAAASGGPNEPWEDDANEDPFPTADRLGSNKRHVDSSQDEQDR